MAIRLIVTITAAPGRGSELAQAYKPRCAEVMKEPGCEQFEVFQSVVNPDKLALLERWTDKAALGCTCATEQHSSSAATRAAGGGKTRARRLRVQPDSLTHVSIPGDRLDSSTNRERKFTLLDIDVAQVSLAAEFLDEPDERLAGVH